MHEESEDAEAVVHGDDDHPVLREVRAFLARFRCGAGDEAATVDPHHHRKFSLPFLPGAQTLR